MYAVWLLMLLALLVAAPTWAHDPFDGAIRMIVQNDTIEVKVTLGSDAVRGYLTAGKMQPKDIARMTRPSSEDKLIDVPLTIAPQLMMLQLGHQILEPQSFVVAPNENESIFLLTYAKPIAEAVLVRATYFDSVEYMRAGSFAATIKNGRILATALLSKSNPSVNVPLKLVNAAEGSPPMQPSFGEFFKLGVWHILTGFDHLLFLCALLIGVRKIRPMLLIITAFTLAHSITLAVAALGLIVISPRIVEPLIAASIIFVGVENFLRQNATTDRYWMASAFGLIHGFGFASVLRETALGQPGSSIVMPLLSFNLGVETGQLLVAALVVPLLLFLRKKPSFIRYGAPTISAIVIVISGYWLLQRIFVF